MTDEQINTAIAEACGWKFDQGYRWKDSNGLSAFAWDIPDYCTDLNAMHEVEKVLTIRQEKNYFANLTEIVGDLIWYRTVGKTYRATARERAEAFLRALGLWKTDHSGERTEMEVQK